MPILKLQPIHKDYVWGGRTLIEDYNMKTQRAAIAESWTLSCHPDGESLVEDMNQSLVRLLQQHPEYLGERGRTFDFFPIMVKLIDANQNLSIQVHPNDEMGKELENEYGKTEMWYVLDAKPDAYLYFGFNQDMTQQQFIHSIHDDTLLEKLNQVFVKPGDVFFVEAGIVHAIGAGIVIAEIQQSSNSTYRIYDFNRMGVDGKPRALHIDKAVRAATLTKSEIPTATNNIGDALSSLPSHQQLVSCPYFTVSKLNLQGNETIMVDAQSFVHLQVVAGEGYFDQANKKTPFSIGDSFFISADFGEIHLSGSATILISKV